MSSAVARVKVAAGFCTMSVTQDACSAWYTVSSIFGRGMGRRSPRRYEPNRSVRMRTPSYDSMKVYSDDTRVKLLASFRAEWVGGETCAAL